MSYSFDSLENQYIELIDKMEIRANWEARMDRAARQIISGKDQYTAVSEKFEDLYRQPVPWQFVGIIHHLEGDCDFDTHLHNGDSLRHRTIHEPRGRPAIGSPPFTWEESALDALSQRDFRGIQNWTAAQLAYQFEAYNGWGYRQGHSGVNSPYLWSGTTNYSCGKYVADHVFDPEAVSEQCGAMGLLSRIMALDLSRPQIRDGSRKLSLIDLTTKVSATSVGGYLTLDTLQIIPDQVKHFSALGLNKDQWLLIGFAGIIIAVLTVVKEMTHQDYSKGSYTPSKAPENFFDSKVKL